MTIPAKPVLLSLALLALLGCGRSPKEAEEVADLKSRLNVMEARTSDVGRFQIVNGTPAFAHNIMLVDTKTGRAWIACNSKDSLQTTETNWCAMRHEGTGTVP